MKSPASLCLLLWRQPVSLWRNRRGRDETRGEECCLLLLYIIRCYCAVLYCPESNHNGRGKKDRKCVWDLYHLTWPWHDLYSVRLLRPAAALLSLMRGSKFRNAIAKIF